MQKKLSSSTPLAEIPWQIGLANPTGVQDSSSDNLVPCLKEIFICNNQHLELVLEANSNQCSACNVGITCTILGTSELFAQLHSIPAIASKRAPYRVLCHNPTRDNQGTSD